MKAMIDVLIVGGGPAGSTLAAKLAERGKKVLLLEKHKVPRYKTCSGGLTPRCLNYLPYERISKISKAVFEIDFTFGRKNLVTLTKEEPLLYLTMRSELDESLFLYAQEKGAQVSDDEELESLILHEDFVEVKTKKAVYKTKFLVGADGVSSKVAKLSHWPKQSLVVPSIEAELTLPAGGHSYSDKVRFDLSFLNMGYACIFPKKGHLSVGIGSIDKSLKLKDALDSYYEETNLKSEDVFKSSGFSIPVSARERPLARERVSLIGDAAGLADPLSGEGIYYAIQSANLLADAFVKSDFSLGYTHIYEELLEKNILRELDAASELASIFYHNRKVFDLLLKWKGQEFCEKLAELFLGHRTYEETIERKRFFIRSLETLRILKNPPLATLFKSREESI